MRKPIDEESELENLFPKRSNCWRLVRKPIDEESEPENLLPERDKTRRWVRKPIDEESELENLLSERSNCWRLVRKPIDEGSEPEIPNQFRLICLTFKSKEQFTPLNWQISFRVVVSLQSQLESIRGIFVVKVKSQIEVISCEE